MLRTLIVLLCLAPAALAGDLAGLWKAKKRFGPDARGPLLIERSGTTWTAEMMGRLVPVRAERNDLTFTLPNEQGTFRGRLAGGRITGHWLRPAAPSNISVYASPVVLEPAGANRWSGNVVPFEDEFTFFLLLQPRADGSYGAILRNPERDMGGQYGVDRLTRDGNAIKLLGRRDRVVATGTIGDDVLTLNIPNRGWHYDFTREGDESDFYPRGKTPARYSYRQPPARDDGWLTATVESVNISRAGIEQFIRKLAEMPMEAADALQVHAILIVRNGRLVVEEYFHGEHRDKLHETRSAAKSLTSILAGAAMHAGAPLSLATPVYPGNEPDERKRAMTLEHLLTMSAGFFCDDTNEEAPGNEERMLDQTEEPDYYRYTMRVPLATPPGEKAVYCSAMPNLALGMVGRATGESPMATFDRLVAAPLKIRRYGWPLDPAGNPYGGGSVQLLPRDFLKLGQLMLNGGTWDGRRILDREYVARASAPLYHLRNIQYGYLWWNEEIPYKDRTVRAYSARGAGGQTVSVIPELDLVVATLAGNYGSGRLTLAASTSLIPRFILPAVRERGDDPNAPVAEREFTTPYGPSPNGSRFKADGAP